MHAGNTDYLLRVSTFHVLETQSCKVFEPGSTHNLSYNWRTQLCLPGFVSLTQSTPCTISGHPQINSPFCQLEKGVGGLKDTPTNSQYLNLY